MALAISSPGTANQSRLPSRAVLLLRRRRPTRHASAKRGGGNEAMRVATGLPCAVRVIEHTWVPARDGCRLSAKIWLLEDAATRPVPAILEYIPYRKRDAT